MFSFSMCDSCVALHLCFCLTKKKRHICSLTLSHHTFGHISIRHCSLCCCCCFYSVCYLFIHRMCGLLFFYQRHTNVGSNHVFISTRFCFGSMAIGTFLFPSQIRFGRKSMLQTFGFDLQKNANAHLAHIFITKKIQQSFVESLWLLEPNWLRSAFRGRITTEKIYQITYSRSFLKSNSRSG